MPASVFPLPVAETQVRSFMSGVLELLSSLSEQSGESETDIIAAEVRTAQGELERTTTIPFFVTRFSTRVLGIQENQTLGVDYDRQEQPLSYDADGWSSGREVVSLPWIPLNDVNALILTLSGPTGKLAAVPPEWIERNDEKGELYVIPHGNTLGLSIFTNLFGFNPFTSQPIGGVTPALMHVRYSAGLVKLPTSRSQWPLFNPAEAVNRTDYWPERVASYQTNIAKLASAGVMRRVATELDWGGVSVAIDGLSESINPGMLETRADRNQTASETWAQKVKEQVRGMTLAFA